MEPDASLILQDLKDRSSVSETVSDGLGWLTLEAEYKPPPTFLQANGKALAKQLNASHFVWRYADNVENGLQRNGSK